MNAFMDISGQLLANDTANSASGRVTRGSQPSLSVIVPAYRAQNVLAACLDGLTHSDLARNTWQLIVVDDGSDDDTATIARSVADVTLVTDNGPRGPAYARNLGATHATGSVLVFVDSDVVVAHDTLSGFQELFAINPKLGAAFGAYDALPADNGFVSQYRNLLHRYVHLQHAGNASTFWAGCGAVRRDAFIDVSGFDATRYPRPQIEDIDLGYRLSDAGYHIQLEPALVGKHLKRWTFSGMLRTDFHDRAVPWMRLLMERKETVANGALNTGSAEKVYAVMVWLAVVSLVLAPLQKSLLLASLILLMIVVAANAPLLAWFARERGWRFATATVPLRILYYLAGGAGAAWAVIAHRSDEKRSPLPPLKDATHEILAGGS